MNKTRSILGLAISIALTFTFSCSSDDLDIGQGGSFNIDPQIYIIDSSYWDDNFIRHYEIGEAYKGSGNLDISSYVGNSQSCTGGKCSQREYEWEHIRAGSVTNGIVSLNLPKSIPDEYLEDFVSGEEQSSCSSYPKGIKTGGGKYVLTDKNILTNEKDIKWVINLEDE